MKPSSETAAGLPLRPYRRIATEEAFSPPQMLEIYRRILDKPDVDVGFKHLMGFYRVAPASERSTSCVAWWTWTICACSTWTRQGWMYR